MRVGGSGNEQQVVRPARVGTRSRSPAPWRARPSCCTVVATRTARDHPAPSAVDVTGRIDVPARTLRPSRMPTPSSRPLLAIVLLASACASSGGSATPGDVVQTTRPVDTGAGGVQGMQLRSVTEDFARATVVEVAPTEVFAVLPAVYDELKLPVSTLVSSERRIASQNARFRDRVGGERAARIVSCGTAADGREAADSYELTLDIATVAAARPDGQGTDVKTVVSGLAKPVFTSGEPVRCASTGRLEARIAAAVRAKLAK